MRVKLWIHCLMGVVCTLGLTTQASARTLEEVQASGVLRVAADGASPPFNSYRDNLLVGFEVDLAQDIARQLQVKLTWLVRPFDQLLGMLQTDEADLIATSHTVTPARQQVADFLVPHYCNDAVLVTVHGPRSIKELPGQTVAVPTGTVYLDHLQAMQTGATLLTVSSETEALQALLEGRADVWVTEEPIARQAQLTYADSHLIVGEALFSQVNAMTVAKNNAGLRQAVDDALNTMLRDGTYACLSAHYFRQDFSCP